MKMITPMARDTYRTSATDWDTGDPPIKDGPKPMTIKKLRNIKREISRHLRKERNKLKNLAKLQNEIGMLRADLAEAQREFGIAACQARGY